MIFFHRLCPSYFLVYKKYISRGWACRKCKTTAKVAAAGETSTLIGATARLSLRA
ncbi:MAG: hypothetical protein O4805_24220 [Trichodesmium sp. St16_bin2-tuft]|nr:hypothetical protein [Trichodesmium sp. St16_bin2-tuft]